ncbi:MAG: PilN domain-containing protein [Marinisporobacter sp.]|jgi:Tfp pilus assembly protein PilN|nr:PilN domain-containing protein [Marinisporobacter sp.]
MKDINFFSSYTNVKRTSTKKFLSVGIIFILVIGSLGWLTFFNIQKERRLQEEIVSLQAELAKEEQNNQSNVIEEKKNKIDLLTQHYEAVKKINLSIDRIDKINSSLLKTIGSALPQRTFIKGLTINIKRLKFQGISTNRVAVAELEYNLKQTNIFSDVHIQILNNYATNSDHIQFNVECIFFKDVINYEDD